MQLGMIGLGRMGAGLTRRLLAAGHDCVVYDTRAEVIGQLHQAGATASTSIEDLVCKLKPPRIVWIMLPAAMVGQMVSTLDALLSHGDILIDGGNSHFRDDRRRAQQFAPKGIHYIDVGTSGGIWGQDVGFCLMIGGEQNTVNYLEPIFTALAPGIGAAPRTPGRVKTPGSAERGYLHCGPSGAGHFVKMIHNGIEYGLMQAYAEGFNILRHANAGTHAHTSDAETAPLDHPEDYRYNFKLDEIAELWRRGSVIRSWLLDLSAHALLADPELKEFKAEVADSGEGRWALHAAIDTSVPAPVLSAAVYARFGSRDEDDYAHRLLSALRSEFGGHAADKPSPGK